MCVRVSTRQNKTMSVGDALRWPNHEGNKEPLITKARGLGTSGEGGGGAVMGEGSRGAPGGLAAFLFSTWVVVVLNLISKPQRSVSLFLQLITVHNFEIVQRGRGRGVGGRIREALWLPENLLLPRCPVAADPLSSTTEGTGAHAEERACPEACGRQSGRGRSEGRGDPVRRGAKERINLRISSCALHTAGRAGLANIHK